MKALGEESGTPASTARDHRPSPWAEEHPQGSFPFRRRRRSRIVGSNRSVLVPNVHMPDESPLLDIPETEDANEIELPRWVQVPIGIILSLFTLLCGFASAYLLFVPNKKAPILTFIVGLVLLLGCVWVLAKCFRLISGRKHRGGLMSPRALRVVSACLLVLPIIGLFTGYYREMGSVAIFQAVMYFFGFLGLRALARRRETGSERNRDECDRAEDD
jgi:hypothetical protein